MRPHLREFRFQEIAAIPTADQALENEFVAGWANHLVTHWGRWFLNGLRHSVFKYMAASRTRCDGPKQKRFARGARNNLV
jgi:hypothetical protein